MTVNAKLQLADNSKEIAVSHRNFIRDLLGNKSLAIDLLRRTQYWVYDPSTKTFSPSKFSGYVAMDFPHYVAAREGRSSGSKFDGGITQRAISQILGEYRRDDNLANALEDWAYSVFQIEDVDDVLADIDRDKWRFVQLPASGVGGLAALAGGWEGSDDLVETVLALRRSAGRDAPEME